jgi:hypothetical protein
MRGFNVQRLGDGIFVEPVIYCPFSLFAALSV